MLRFGRAVIQSASDFIRLRYVFLSAAISFYTLLAIVPVLILIASIGSLLPIEAINWNRILQSIFPNLLLNNAQIISFFTQHRGAYGITGLIGAYILSQGLFRTLDQALAYIFEIQPRKFNEYILLQLAAIPIFVLAMITLYVLATMISEFMNNLLLLPFFSGGLPYYLADIAKRITGLFGLVTIFWLLFLIYHFLAPRKIRKFSDSISTTVFICVFFFLLRMGFGFYFTHFSNVQHIYGAFSWIFGVLLWVFVGYDLIVLGARILFYLDKAES